MVCEIVIQFWTDPTISISFSCNHINSSYANCTFYGSFNIITQNCLTKYSPNNVWQKHLKRTQEEESRKTKEYHKKYIIKIYQYANFRWQFYFMKLFNINFFLFLFCKRKKNYKVELEWMFVFEFIFYDLYNYSLFHEKSVLLFVGFLKRDEAVSFSCFHNSHFISRCRDLCGIFIRHWNDIKF